MTRSRRGRWTPIARGVLVLAAILLLPLAATLQTPRESAAQSAGQDSLWAVSGGTVGVCVDPSSSASLSGCFASATSTWPGSYDQAVATDGVNVYFVGEADGGLSCPIAGLGANCTPIMAGPWPHQSCPSSGCEPVVLAAANGFLWIGQFNGQIYRCPSNLPYVKQNSAPSQCVLLDDAGQRPVYSLLLANGTLYAGLGAYGSEQKKQGLLWSCSPDTVNSCAYLDGYGNTEAYSLTAGGGYLWAGLADGRIWQCDLNIENACDTDFETAGGYVNSLSYDGQGTLYAAIQSNGNKNPGVIWSCPTAYANGCSNVLSDASGHSVAAGAGGVFSSTYPDGDLHFNTSPFTSENGNIFDSSILLYIPAEGPVGVGGVKMNFSANRLSQKIENRCATPGKTPKGIVPITGPNNFPKTMKVGACDLVQSGSMTHRVDLLDPGDYTVTVQAGKHSGEASFTIVPDQTKPVKVKLTRGSTGG